jgi:hypothetical protein
MWKDIVQPDGPQMTKRRMRIACWITEAIDTHSEYETPFVFPQQKWLRERVSVRLIVSALPASAFCGQWYQHQDYANLWWEKEQYLVQYTA